MNTRKSHTGYNLTPSPLERGRGEAYTLFTLLFFLSALTLHSHAQIRTSAQSQQTSSDTSLLKKTQIKAVSEARNAKSTISTNAKNQATDYKNTVSPEQNKSNVKSIAGNRKEAIKEKLSAGDKSVTFSNTDQLADALKTGADGFYQSELDATGKDINNLKNNFSSLNTSPSLGKLPGVSEKITPKSIGDLNDAAYRDKMAKDALPEIKRVYSEKALKKIYDSLGLTKADSLARIVYAVSKNEVTEQEMLEAINNSFPEHTPKNSVQDTSKLSALGKGNYDQLYDELAKPPDLSSLKLSDSLMQELPAVNSRLLDSKYLKKLDSLRDLSLKVQNLKMDEQTISENIKATIIKDKPGFWDKSYFEGIVSYAKNGQVTVFQASPSLAYHFTKSLSVGLGPNISINLDEKKVNMQAGFRSFVKNEIWKQRAYMQVEDNVNPFAVSTENARNAKHQILAGGGLLVPVSKSIALNMSVLYTVNKGSADLTSPWVFRVGISSIGDKKKK